MIETLYLEGVSILLMVEKNMKKIEIAVFGVICILIGIALAGYIVSSGETPEKTMQKDSDRDGWTDIQEREVHTNPFDVDSDHDGIQDPEDPEPLHPGILTNPEQKLEGGGSYEYDAAIMFGSKTPYIVTVEDPLIPKELTLLTTKLDIPSGYACYRSYFSFEINASSPQVIDFFLENMPRWGWHTCNASDRYCNKPELFDFYGIYGAHMQFFQKGDQDRYLTILVIGEETYPYSQVIEIEEVVD